MKTYTTPEILTILNSIEDTDDLQAIVEYISDHKCMYSHIEHDLFMIIINAAIKKLIIDKI